MNKGDRTFPIGRKEKERKRATETRLSFIDGCRDVSLPWNSHTFFLSSSALWLPLEEAEKADNYFHAAACSCTWIERVGVPRGTSHSASNTNNYWQTSSMFAETAGRRDSSSTPREMQRHRVDCRETEAPFVCLDTLGVITHPDFFQFSFRIISINVNNQLFGYLRSTDNSTGD